MIDMSLMKKVTVSASKKTVVAQGLYPSHSSCKACS